MDGLCGTSSSWLYDVPALEPKYNESGKFILVSHPQYPASID